MSSEPRRPPPVEEPVEPRADAMSAALEHARAARAELQELRRRREEAIKRADAAIKALGSSEQPKSANRVQDALDNIDRVTRIPTPGPKR